MDHQMDIMLIKILKVSVARSCLPEFFLGPLEVLKAFFSEHLNAIVRA
jgi:hypothetical protein